MSKGNKSSSLNKNINPADKHADQKEIKSVKQIRAEHLGQESSLVMMLPAIVFSAVVILLVRFKYYYMPMSQFSWTSWSDDGQLSDFFSKVKMEAIVACAIAAALLLLYKFTVGEIAIKKTWFYIPMGVYSLFVILSYIFSDYKEFALWGWHERFEGTITLLCYMVMLFFIINVVNSEKNIKMLLWPIGISAGGLSLLGLTQLTNHDFFKTALGQKLIVPNLQLENGYKYWELIEADAAKGQQTFQFNMAPGTVYQTVFNINYVSFYLALLIPVFTMLFIRAMNKESGEPWWKKVLLGLLIALMLVNDIGSKSSGGYVGLAAAIVVAVIVLNVRLVKMLKPLLIVAVVMVIGLFATASKWQPVIADQLTELKNTVNSIKSNTSHLNSIQMDYIETDGLDINLSLNGEPLTVGIAVDGEKVMGLYVHDGDDNSLELIAGEGEQVGTFTFTDERYAPYISLCYGANEGGYLQLDLIVGGHTYSFLFGGDQMYYLTAFGRPATLSRVEHSKFFAKNPSFGSGRGYIWSTALPLLKKSVLVGTGADTFCIVFPQNDIAGRFSANTYTDSTVVDKPHNIYLGVGIGTGVLSLIAFLALFGGYIIQTFVILWKRSYGADYIPYVSAGAFFGIIGFLVAGLANDSSVSTMPMLYTMLGIGIAINLMTEKKAKEGEQDAA